MHITTLLVQPTNNKGDIVCPTTLYSKNERFFDDINEKSMYWAGFLAADGCIQTKKLMTKRKGETEYLSGLSLNLASKDKSHIVLFRKHIGSNAPITDGIVKNSKNNPKWKDTANSKIVIRSHKIYRSLEKFNIVPRKTHTYTFPEWIVDHPLANHFMRGYFDGDGSIEFDNIGNKRFGLRGTIDFLNTYKTVLIRECNVNDNLVKNASGIARVRYNGNKVCIVLYDFLYKDATIYLNRKKEIFEADAKDYQQYRKR